jgi:hypothetical protein
MDEPVKKKECGCNKGVTPPKKMAATPVVEPQAATLKSAAPAAQENVQSVAQKPIDCIHVREQIAALASKVIRIINKVKLDAGELAKYKKINDKCQDWIANIHEQCPDAEDFLWALGTVENGYTKYYGAY